MTKEQKIKAALNEYRSKVYQELQNITGSSAGKETGLLFIHASQRIYKVPFNWLNELMNNKVEAKVTAKFLLVLFSLAVTTNREQGSLFKKKVWSLCSKWDYYINYNHLEMLLVQSILTRSLKEGKLVGVDDLAICQGFFTQKLIDPSQLSKTMISMAKCFTSVQLPKHESASFNVFQTYLISEMSKIMSAQFEGPTDLWLLIEAEFIAKFSQKTRTNWWEKSGTAALVRQTVGSGGDDHPEWRLYADAGMQAAHDFYNQIDITDAYTNVALRST
ncbi:hypothetical protein [Shewanella youngdeokensis]|uniref:Uncharacterized protein n=1 Tax=Shewanella youngdeokensis TaxID=2999068 RepID=A0ABZ0JXP8_9GAMM|nr:hypothetical protein RGE70_13780 [Shewanella sp. DAU334]